MTLDIALRGHLGYDTALSEHVDAVDPYSRLQMAMDRGTGARRADQNHYIGGSS
jgi:hypothetical protein